MSEVKRYGHIGYLVDALPQMLQMYPGMTVYVLAEDFDRIAAENQALQQRLTTVDQRIDELEGQLAAVPPQADAQPVGYRVQRVTPTGNARLDRPLLTLAKPEEWGPAWKAEALYTHSDADEAYDLLAATSLEFGERLEALEQERDTLRAQLAELERTNATLCEMRTREQYLSMIDAGQQDALLALDKARADARKALSASAEPEVKP
jgi:prefoldin subunit 5